MTHAPSSALVPVVAVIAALVFSASVATPQTVSTDAHRDSSFLPQKSRTGHQIVALGTSLTARSTWPARLQSALADRHGLAATVLPIAEPGATSRWALQQIGKISALQPGIVLIELHANDAALNRFISADESRRNLEELLIALRTSVPGVRLFVMAMNPVWGPRGWMRPFHQSYIEAHRQAALTAGAGFIDFGGRWAMLDHQQLEHSIPDGLHPTPDAAAAIIVPELVRIIERQDLEPAR